MEMAEQGQAGAGEPEAVKQGGALAPRPLAAPRGKRGLLRPIPRQLPLCGVSLSTYPATLLLLRAGL